MWHVALQAPSSRNICFFSPLKGIDLSLISLTSRLLLRPPVSPAACHQHSGYRVAGHLTRLSHHSTPTLTPSTPQRSHTHSPQSPHTNMPTFHPDTVLAQGHTHTLYLAQSTHSGVHTGAPTLLALQTCTSAIGSTLRNTAHNIEVPHMPTEADLLHLVQTHTQPSQIHCTYTHVHTMQTHRDAHPD